MFRVTKYARSPEVKSERTTQQKPRQHYGKVVVVEIQKIIFQTTDSVRCEVGIWHQAITQVKQLGAGLVLACVTAGLRSAYRNVERKVTFSDTVDWGQTL